jgi:peptidoglycan/xylan/chitin deacetylase (PgdA/CDA1 family)
MKQAERSLIEQARCRKGRYGGFCFGGCQPEGVRAHQPLPAGTAWPNGAAGALLLTFDVEGTYGNGTGDMAREVANYKRICQRLARAGIPATFNIVGRMAEEQGPQFIRWMLDCGSEIATHGYEHELNRRHGGDAVYAGHYGPAENLAQIRDGVAALDKQFPGSVRGVRMPYGHFNEFTYDAIAELGLTWASNVSIDDFLVPGGGFGPAPFRMQLGDKIYPVVEIPLDSQTYDWCIWAADETANRPFVEAVRAYCERTGIPFDRTPAGGVPIWMARCRDALKRNGLFTLLCHPINLVAESERWKDPVEEFLFPVIDELGRLHRSGEAFVGTCGQVADVYLKWQASQLHD